MPRLRRISVRAFVMLLVSLVLVPLSLAAETTGWANKSAGKPSMKDLIPKPSTEEAYSERYAFAVDLDDGAGHIGVDLTITNLGWGDQNAAEDIRVRLKGEKKYQYKGKLDDDEWSYSKSKFRLDIGKTQVTAEGPNSIRIRHNGDVSFDVVFKNRVAMWKPGGGKITTADGYYKYNLAAPRADVSGSVTIGGKTIRVNGTRAGYGDHIATNATPYDLGKRFSRMRDYNGDVFVMWREITVTEEHGGKSYGWLVVGYKDQIVFSDAAVRMREANNRADGKSGYSIPLSIQVEGTKGNDTVKLVMKGKRFKRKDLLENYGDAAKAVASAFTKPMRFDIKCKYQLQMTIGGTTATIGGKSNYVIDQLN